MSLRIGPSAIPRQHRNSVPVVEQDNQAGKTAHHDPSSKRSYIRGLQKTHSAVLPRNDDNNACRSGKEDCPVAEGISN